MNNILKISTRSFGIALVLFVAMAIGLPASGSVGTAAPAVQAVAPEAILPGDAAITAAFGDQEEVQIAAGNGIYLAVWEDSRTNFINVIDGMGISGGDQSGQQMRDIYAARLDANGNLIDNNPIVVNQKAWSQHTPQVSWNGQNWLVVWDTERAANFSYTRDIMAARVSPAGQVLDNPAITIDAIPTIDEMFPMVASDGNNWVVLWLDTGAYFEIDATRVSPEGTVLDPGGLPIHTPSFPAAPYNFSIAYAGGEYMLVYQGDNDIKGRRYSTSLQPIGSPFQVTPYGNFPDVTTNGTDYFAAWQYDSGVHATRISHNGAVLDPTRLNLTGQNGGYPFPDVAWDGTNWVTVWASGENKTILSRVSPSGQILDPNGIVVSTTNYRTATVVGRPNGGSQVAWTDTRLMGLGSLNSYDIFTAQVSVDGTPGVASSIAQAAPRQLWPDLASNGSGYMAVFQSAISGETRIMGQRLNADGTPIDVEPFLIMGGSKTLVKPRVAWNGTVYLVVWEDTSISRGWVPGAVFGKRVGLDGTVLDASPIDIMNGNTPDVAALNGVFLVVDTFEPTNHIRPVYGVRVGGDGAVIGAPDPIGSSYARSPNVEPLGDRWLVVWQDHPTHDNPRSNISGIFINADGSEDEFTVADPGLDPAKTPDIAVGNNQALITYYAGIGEDVSQGDVYGRRILPDGTLLDGNPGIQITTANIAQFVPSGVWTGSEYLVAYEDFRNVGYLEKPISDIYATRIDANGTVLDPNGFVVANLFLPEVNPILESNPAAGHYLLGFANFKYEAPYSNYRIDIRHGSAGQQPVPASATPTNTPSPTPPTCVAGNYVVTESSGATIVPGTTDIGNHCDECATVVNLPFAFTLYDMTFNTVEATANGTLNFVDSSRTGGVNFCLPYSFLDYSIVPHWHDMMTVNDGGIYTSISGTSPNRIFNIEWRACSFGGSNCGAERYNFEVRLYEGGTGKFEVIFGEVDGNGRYTTVGVQKGSGQRFTQYACSMSGEPTGLDAGLKLTFEMDYCGTPTAVPTAPTGTPVVPTNTAVSSATSTAVTTAEPSATTPGGATETSVPTSTSTTEPGATETAIATATLVACQISFTDVPPGSTFYEYVQCLACREILGGYPDGTFLPGNSVTRGQLSKIVSNAAGWEETVTGQSFTDVPEGSTFYVFIERMAGRGIISGYADGTFRPSDPASRGQISKIVARAYGYEDPMSAQTFEDVVPGSTFFLWIENLAVRQIMNGYPCGGPGEPCGTEGKSYFRPSSNATRGQVAKIVSNTFFPECTP